MLLFSEIIVGLLLLSFTFGVTMQALIMSLACLTVPRLGVLSLMGVLGTILGTYFLYWETLWFVDNIKEFIA